MPDPRILKLAKALVNYAIPVQAGDWFQIRTTELAAPLVREVYREALLASALHVETRIGVDGLGEIFFTHASDEQLTHISEAERLAETKVNAALSILAPHNVKSLSGVDPKRHTPVVAILVSAAAMWLLTVSGTFVYLATFAAIARLLMYGSTCAALIVLRRRAGTAPIAVRWGPVFAVLSLLVSISAILTTTGTAIRDLAIAVALGWALRTAVRARN